MQAINSVTNFLLIEDNLNNFDSVELLLKKIGNSESQVFKFNNLTNNLNFLRCSLVEIIIVNLKLKTTGQLNIKQKLDRVCPNIPIIFIVTDEQDKELIQDVNLDSLSREKEIWDYIYRQELSADLLKKSIIHTLAKAEMAKKIRHVEQTNLQLESQLKQTQKLFKTVVDSTSTLMWMIDVKQKYTFLNQSWLSFTGQTLKEGLKENWRDRIHPEDIDTCNKAYHSALKQCQGFQIEYRLRRFDDTFRTVLNTAVRRHNSAGEFAGLLCSCVDITQRKKAEQQVIIRARTDCILAKITQNIHSSLELDIILKTATEEVNQYLCADRIFITKIADDNQLVLLFESQSAVSSARCNITILNKLPNQELINNFDRLSQGKIITSNNNSLTEIINSLGEAELPSESYSLLLVPIIEDQKLWGLFCVEQNFPPRSWRLDEIKLLKQVVIQLGIAIKQSELYQKLEELSIIDGLTKIANRRKFDRYLTAEWRRLTREKKPLSLIICDIDYFKLYNDTYGHQAGDRCLQQVAQAISKAIKRPADLVARYGGEEFAVILPNTDINGAKHLAQQIRLQIQILKIPHINSPIDMYITSSFGVAGCIPNSDIDFYNLITAADKGLYQAKKLGRNRVVNFDVENL